MMWVKIDPDDIEVGHEIMVEQVKSDYLWRIKPGKVISKRITESGEKQILVEQESMNRIWMRQIPIEPEWTFYKWEETK
jgi:hypothetical protein